MDGIFGAVLETGSAKINGIVVVCLKNSLYRNELINLNYCLQGKGPVRKIILSQYHPKLLEF